MKHMDQIFQRSDGRWAFWSHDGSEEYGPFDTEGEAWEEWAEYLWWEEHGEVKA